MSRRGLILALFAVAFGVNVSTPLFLIYEVDLDLSVWMVTALYAVVAVGLALPIAFNRFSFDLFARRTLVVPAVLLSGIASLVMMLGYNNLALLFLGRLLLGLLAGLVFPITAGWLSEVEHRGPLWTAGVESIVVFAGFGIGPVIAGVLAQWTPWPLTAPYLVHVAVVGVALAALGDPPALASTDDMTSSQVPELAPEDRAFRRASVRIGLGVFGFPSLLFALFPVLLRRPMGSLAVFVTGIVLGVAMALIVPAQGWVAHLGARRAAPLGLFVGAIGIGIGLLSYSTDWWWLLFPAAFALGAASGLCLTAGLELVYEVAADPRRANPMDSGLYLAVYAGLLTPVIVATVALVTGYELALAGLFAVAAAMTLSLSRQIRSGAL